MNVRGYRAFDLVTRVTLLLTITIGLLGGCSYLPAANGPRQESPRDDKVTRGTGDKTDASFAPDGTWIVFSFQEPGEDTANLYMTSVSGGNPTRVTSFQGYDGAPSWSPDGNKIAFESSPRDPDDSIGTTIWIIDMPDR